MKANKKLQKQAVVKAKAEVSGKAKPTFRELRQIAPSSGIEYASSNQDLCH